MISSLVYAVNSRNKDALLRIVTKLSPVSMGVVIVVPVIIWPGYLFRHHAVGHLHSNDNTIHTLMI